MIEGEVSSRSSASSAFENRILPFDSAAAREYAEILGQRTRAGRPLSVADAQIATIARARGATLATRITKDFTGCHIELENPWKVDT